MWRLRQVRHVPMLDRRRVTTGANYPVMAAIELVLDSSRWPKSEALEKALTRAVSKAGGDAIRWMRTGSNRLVRQRKRFKAGAVREGLPVFFPRSKQHLTDLIWEMKVSGKPMRLSDFPHRRTARGVVVNVNTGKRSLIKSAFIATMKSGHRGVFMRRGRSRLPIDEGFSSRLSDVFNDRGFVPFVQEGAQQKFEISFDRLFALELEKLGAR